MVVFYFHGTAASLMFTAIVRAAVRVVVAAPVLLCAPVSDGDVLAPAAAASVAAGGRGIGHGSRGRGRGA